MSLSSSESKNRLNLKNAEFDQETYSGRVFHFCKLTDPRNALLTESQLQSAKEIVTRHQKGTKFPIIVYIPKTSKARIWA